MTIVRYGNNIFLGLAADSKPTNIPTNAIFIETDTGDVARYNGSSWIDIISNTKTETLSNKTITSPIISSISNTGTLTLPTATDTLVGRATTDTLTNKTLTTPVISTISNSGTVTLPTSTTVLVGRDTTDTLTNKTLTSPVISTISNTGTLTLPTSTDTIVGRDTTDTLTNKTLTDPVISTIVNSGTLTLPTATTTLVGRNTTDTLTNKTLTSPTINSPTLTNSGNTLTLPTATDTLVGRVTTDTLTNKTIDADSNTLSNIENADIKAGAGIVTSKLADSANFVLVNQANTFGAFNQTFPTSRLLIGDSDASHSYIIAGSNLAASRTITLPLLTGNDTAVTEAHTQTLTNKTLGTTTMSDAANIILNTVTGTKIGTAVSQKLAFYNSVPISQPSGIADVDTSTIDSTYGVEEAAVIGDLRSKLNSVIAKLESLGLIATV